MTTGRVRGLRQPSDGQLLTSFAPSTVIPSCPHSDPQMLPELSRPPVDWRFSTGRVVGGVVGLLLATPGRHVGSPGKAVHSLWIDWGKFQVILGDRGPVDISRSQRISAGGLRGSPPGRSEKFVAATVLASAECDESATRGGFLRPWVRARRRAVDAGQGRRRTARANLSASGGGRRRAGLTERFPPARGDGFWLARGEVGPGRFGRMFLGRWVGNGEPR